MMWRRVKAWWERWTQCNNPWAVTLSVHSNSFWAPSKGVSRSLVLAPGASKHGRTNKLLLCWIPQSKNWKMSENHSRLNGFLASFTLNPVINDSSVFSWSRLAGSQYNNRPNGPHVQFIVCRGTSQYSQSKCFTGQHAQLRPMEPGEERGRRSRGYSR